MSTTLNRDPAIAPIPATAEPRRAKPVQIWAGVGVFWLAVMVSLWGYGLLSGNARPNSIGSSAVPGWMKWTLNGSQAVYTIGGLYALYRLLWRRWRRDGVVSFDGALVIAFLTMWATSDSWATYLRPLYMYNSAAFNVGCPQCQLPGSLSPNWSTHYVEPIGLLGLYAGGLTVGVMIACWVMRKAQARWPRMGKIALTFFMLPAMMLADMALEIPMQIAGWWTYANAIPEVTLFAGKYYQYPIYEGVFMWAMWAGWSLIRYFRNDKGETLVERGLETMRLPQRRKNGLRVLAVIGMVNTIAVLGYHLPLQFVTIHSAEIPEDILKRPYFLHGECGPGTDQACAGRGVPIPTTEDGAHATPDGRLVAPNGLPIQVEPHGRTPAIDSGAR